METNMPKKRNKKSIVISNQVVGSSVPSGDAMKRNRIPYDDGNQAGSVIKNWFATGDESSPAYSLQHLQEMFKDKLEPDVVSMIYGECEYNVEQTVETLLALTTSSRGQSPCEEDIDQVFLSMGLDSFENEPVHNGSYKDNSQNGSDLNSDGAGAIGGQSNKQGLLSRDSSSDVDGSEEKTRLLTDDELQLHDPCHRDNILQNCQLENDAQDDSKSLYPVPQTSSTKCKRTDKCPNVTESRKSVDFLGNQHFSSESTDSNLEPRKDYLKHAPFIHRSGMSLPSPQNENEQTQFFQTNQTPHFITPVLHNTSLKKFNIYPSQDSMDCNVLSSYNTGFQNSEFSNQVTEKWRSNCEDLSYTEKLTLIMQKISDGNLVLIILRGLPGSGKSTLAKHLNHSGVILSTDNYFIKRSKYVFEPRKLGDAHEWNQKNAKKAMSNHRTPVIIDNTNTEIWEMIPYVKMGLRFGYYIEILEPNTKWKFNARELANYNTHGVSKEKIQAMLERYDHNVITETIIKRVKENQNKSNSLPADSNGPTEANFFSEMSSPHTSLDNFHSNLLACSTPSRSGNEKALDPSVESFNDSNVPEFACANIKIPRLNTTFTKEMTGAEDTGFASENSNALKCSSSDFYSNFNIETEKKIDLADLMTLLQQDSEESASHSRHTSASCSSQDISCWEAITEHDDDFLWTSENSISSQPCEGTSETLNIEKCEPLIEELEDAFIDDGAFPTTSEISLSTIEELKFSKNILERDEETISQSCVTDMKQYDWNESKNEPAQPLLNNNMWALWEPQKKALNKDATDNPKSQRLNSKYFIKNPNVLNNSNEDSVKIDDRNLVIPDMENANEVEWVESEAINTKAEWQNQEQLENTEKKDSDNLNVPKPQRLNLIRRPSADIVFHKFKSISSFTDEQQTISQDSENKVPNKEVKKVRSFSKIAANFQNAAQVHEWEFPKFPVSEDKTDKLPLPSTSNKELNDKEAQTELSDFALLYKVQKNFTSSKVHVIIGNLDYKNDAPFTTNETSLNFSGVSKFDKATTTSDIPDDFGVENNVKFLQTCFPTVMTDDLLDVYEKCNGDLSWAANILLDGSVDSGGLRHFKESVSDECNLPVDLVSAEVSPVLFDDGGTALVKTDDVGYNSCEKAGLDISDVLSLDTKEDKESFDIAKTFDSNQDPLQKKITEKQSVEIDTSSSSSLSLTFNQNFAKQLMQLFGPAELQDVSGPLTVEDLTVELSIHLASQLYEAWSDSLRKKEQKKINDGDSPNVSGACSFEKKSDGSDEQNLASSCEKKSDSSGEQNLSSSCKNPNLDFPQPHPKRKVLTKQNAVSYAQPEVVPLKEIMDMELALSLSRQEMIEKVNRENSNLATKLKRNELYQYFPTIDRKALDEAFEANNCLLTETIAVLKHETGECNLGLTREEELILEAETLKEGIGKSLEFSENWMDWVHPTREEPKEKVDFTDLSSFRKEAILHQHLRKESFKKAQEAYHNGLNAAAAFYAQQGRLHSQKMEEANQRAVKKILEVRYTSFENDILDLHGLYVQEALFILKEFIEAKKLEMESLPYTRKFLSIITGKGKHSIRKIPKIRPAVIDYLTKTGYSFEEDPIGLIKLTLPC